MIAKVIAFGADRGEAIERLAGALDGYVIEGLDHNVAFVNQVLGLSGFSPAPRPRTTLLRNSRRALPRPTSRAVQTRACWWRWPGRAARQSGA